MLLELQVVEPCQQVDYRHLHKVGDALAVDFHVRSLLLQSCTVAVGALGLTTIATHHDAILYLVLVLPDHIEEGIYRHLLMRVAVLV